MWLTRSWAFDPTAPRPGYNVAKAPEYPELGGKPDGFEMDAHMCPSELNAPTAWSRYPEPDWNASLIYRSDGHHNTGKVKDAPLDALIDEGAATIDLDKRKTVYRKVDEIVLGEAMMVPMIYGVTYAVAPKNVMALDQVFGRDAPRERMGFVGHAHMQAQRIILGMHRHGRQAHPRRRPGDAGGDFAAVRDQQFRPVHWASVSEAITIGLPRAASRAWASACGRVSWDRQRYRHHASATPME